MGKEKNKPSEIERLAYDIGELVEWKEAAQVLPAMCLVIANICLQSVAPDVIADIFHQDLKDMIAVIRKELNKTNKIN